MSAKLNYQVVVRSVGCSGGGSGGSADRGSDSGGANNDNLKIRRQPVTCWPATKPARWLITTTATGRRLRSSVSWLVGWLFSWLVVIIISYRTVCRLQISRPTAPIAPTKSSCAGGETSWLLWLLLLPVVVVCLSIIGELLYFLREENAVVCASKRERERDRQTGR